MLLLLVRHSQAQFKEDWNDQGYPDMLRPLTKTGISRWAEAVSGLDSFISDIDHIYSSQYTRAIQTAEILHGHYKDSKLREISALNPRSDFKGLKEYLSEHPDDSTIAVVGHGSELSGLISYLLGSNQELKIRHKKGGVALLSIQGDSVQLQWLLNQKQLCYFSSI